MCVVGLCCVCDGCWDGFVVVLLFVYGLFCVVVFLCFFCDVFVWCLC